MRHEIGQSVPLSASDEPVSQFLIQYSVDFIPTGDDLGGPRRRRIRNEAAAVGTAGNGVEITQCRPGDARRHLSSPLSRRQPEVIKPRLFVLRRGPTGRNRCLAATERRQ